MSLGTKTTRFAAPGSVTNGEFRLFEWRMEACQPGAPHFHKTFSVSFYVDFFLDVGRVEGLDPDQLRAFCERHDRYNL
ncbi:hypothetical protein V1227_33450 [Lentzea sp. DG1S-22]|uniref:hypothetical protein n=1 Tax=Lentzea sp. DG1S-22 TaxID=3108822 RepID=UPI002E7929EC|nr:hypothetical protein [Lentzea sp. DG1S-22]WVH79881.1 hypothetical protein V1227_33450 [Lentzea sp. DG1S-22]